MRNLWRQTKKNRVKLPFLLNYVIDIYYENLVFSLANDVM